MPTLLITLLCCAACSAAPIQVGDDALSVHLAEDGAISSVRSWGQEVLAPDALGTLTVHDVSGKQGSTVLRGSVAVGETGIAASYPCDQLGLDVDAVYSAGPLSTVGITLTVRDRTGQDRGLALEFGLPVGAQGWKWWDDPDTWRATEAGQQYANLTRLRGLPGLPEFDDKTNLASFGHYSWYPVAAITGRTGLGLAKPPRDACLFRFGFDGRRGVLYSAWDFALSPDTREPGTARFSLVLLPLRSENGFRGALASLYALWPEDFRARVPSFGAWMPFDRLSEIPDVDEFGFAYQEGAPEPRFDDELGVSSFIYFHCAGEFASIPGYTRDQPLPPYEQQLAALNRVAKGHTGIGDVWGITGIQNPDGTVNILPERVYGHVFSQPCVDPDLPYGNAMVQRLVDRVMEEPAPVGVDGCYYDGIAVGLDYSREHFRVADNPLLWDASLQRPVAYNFFASLEWARAIADTLHPAGKLTMLNDSSMTSFSYAFPYLDVLGAEGGWINSDESFLRARAYSYQKPFCTLLKTDYSKHPQARVESYMRSCMAFGVLPGFFDISPSGANPGSSYWDHPEWYNRDRPLFRRYMPLCAELCRAGWEPVRMASSLTTGAEIERFGAGASGSADGLVYFTIRRDLTEGPPAVGIDLSADLACLKAPDVRGLDLLTGQVLPIREGRLEVEVPRAEVGVIAVGTPAQLSARCLDAMARMIGARQQYQAATESASKLLTGWTPYMTGAELDYTVARTGHASLRATLADPAKMAGAIQVLNLNQSEPEDLIIRGASRAQDVSGIKDSGYSVYVDCYYHNGEKLYGSTIQFSPGTHDWEAGEIRIHPQATISTVSVYCMFRGHTGTVWFDDLFLARASDPERNLLKSPGFEPAVARATTDAVRDAFAQLDARREQALKLVASLDADGLTELAAATQSDLAGFDALEARDAGARARRDLADAADLARLALIAFTGNTTAVLWPQRLTEPSPLVATAPAPAAPNWWVVDKTTGVPAGTRLSVDSNFSGYQPDVLADGRINPDTPDWTRVAWASADDPRPHWIRMDFPAPRRVGKVTVHWALDGGVRYRSRDVRVEVRDGESWKAVDLHEEGIDANNERTVFSFEPVTAESLRIYQPASGGPAGRPDILWVTEVQVE